MRILATTFALVLSLLTAAPAVASPSDPIAVSTYRGEYWTPRSDKFWQCIRDRESNGNYKARNPNSSASGSLQWLDSSWRHGLAHMVHVALHAAGIPKRESLRIRDELRSTPIHRWSRYHQDVAAFASLNWNGELSNARHWYYSGSRCNALGGM